MGQEKDKEKAVHTFAIGDRVFAKVKGYPPWPAYVVNEEKFARNKVKYNVIFYHTNENACCKPDDIFPYALFKDKYGKPSKRPYFNRALELIENDMPTFAKYSYAEKMSAVQADVEEIQKYTKKRALEEESNSDSSKNNKRRRDVSESSDHSSPNTPQKQKTTKKSDNVDSHDKGNIKKTESTDQIGDSSQTKKKENEKPVKKRKMTKPVKHLFHAKTLYGENPSIHLEKVKTFEDVNDEPASSKGTAKRRNEKNTGQVLQKKTAPKAGRREANRERQENPQEPSQQKNQAVGRKQRINKENEKDAGKGVAEKNSSSKSSSRLSGWKRRTREQYDVTSFERGDQVFAKVRGYPPWPAVVTAVVNENRKRKKYHVTFYASNQRGVCPPEHIFPYELYKDEYGSPHKKNAGFNMALGLIRKAAGNIATDGNVTKRSGKHQKAEPPNGDLSDNDSPVGESHNGQSAEEEPPDDKLDREKPNGTEDKAEDK